MFGDGPGVDAKIFVAQLDPTEGFDLFASPDGIMFSHLGFYEGPSNSIFPTTPISIEIDFNGESVPAGARYLRIVNETPLNPSTYGTDFDAVGVREFVPRMIDNGYLISLGERQIVTGVDFGNLRSAVDLTVDQIDTSGLTFDGQLLTLYGDVSAMVANSGSDEVAEAFEVLFFEDRDFDQSYTDDVDTVLGSAIVTDAVGAEQSLAVTAQLSGEVPYSGALVWAFVDSRDEVLESDEENNYAHSGQDCEFVPEPGTFDPALEWSWTSSPIDGDSLNIMMTPAIIDLNGDQIPDVVFGSTSSRGGGLVEIGVLRALSGDTGAELFTVTDPSLQVNTAASLAVGDIDLDGRPEIIATDSTGRRIIAFEHDGTFKWRTQDLEAINWGAAVLADLDQDGTPEIVVGRQVLNSDGSLRWTGQGGRASQPSFAGPLSAVADINMDGRPDVLAGNTLYDASGSIIWQAAVPDGYNAIANFDDDGFPEIVLVTSGTLMMLEHDGSVKWGPVPIPGGGAGGPPTVADYDGDGATEIGVAGAIRYAVFEANGSLKWESVTGAVPLCAPFSRIKCGVRRWLSDWLHL